MSDEKTDKVIKTTKFKSAGDWINTVFDTNCVSKNVGAVDEVKDAEGKVTARAKKGKDVVDLEAVKKLAAENGFEVKTYPNTGMYRMNVGNMLRAAARKRGGLNINGVFTKAPDDFKVNDPLTENPDGSKIAKAVAPKAAETAAEAPAEPAAA